MIPQPLLQYYSVFLKSDGHPECQHELRLARIVHGIRNVSFQLWYRKRNRIGTFPVDASHSLRHESAERSKSPIVIDFRQGRVEHRIRIHDGMAECPPNRKSALFIPSIRSGRHQVKPIKAAKDSERIQCL